MSALEKALDNLEVAFTAWGRAGANADVAHPLREPWLRAREVLDAAGRLGGSAAPGIKRLSSRTELQCWRCLKPITDGRYRDYPEGPAHKDRCP